MDSWKFGAPIAALVRPAYVPYRRRAQAALAGYTTGVSAAEFILERSPDMSDAPIELTENAARRVAEILRQEPAGSFLRIGVDGGGCSGFSYTYGISMEHIAGDLVIKRDGATVAIDPVSLDLLRGSKVDFVDGLMGRMFKIDNPLATASCGCGSSFAV
jgi:iron-sulfur cluster assembly accessory protein